MKQTKILSKSLLLLFSLSFLSGCASQTTSIDDTKVNIEEKKEIQDNGNKPSEKSNVDTNLPKEGDDKENPSTDKEDNSTTNPVQEPDPTPDSPSTPDPESDPESGQDPNPTTDPEVNPDEHVADGEISLNVHSISIFENQTYQFQLTKNTNLPLFYTSDIEDIVQVSSSGLITGKRIGKTKITVRDSVGNDDYCIVEVKQNPNFKLNKNYMDLYVGETSTITTSVSGTTYTSEDENIATIDSNGNINAISAGVVNLVARKNNSVDRCQLRVVLRNHSLYDFEEVTGGYSVKSFSSSASTEDKKNVIIPYEYNNKPVIGVSNSAFNSISGVNIDDEIVLPNSIKTIGSSAFMRKRFSKSKTLFLPNELESIERFGFEGGYFEYIYFPRKEFTITTYAFQNCHSLKKIYLHDKINLQKDPFHDCYGTGGGIGITHMFLEEGITEIPEQLCVALHELEYFNIPSSTTKINSSVLYMMKYPNFGIRELVIPKTVETIASSIYSFSVSTGETIPDIPLKILYERETKPSTYFNFNDDSAYYYSKTQPTTSDKRYWHYVNNVPTIW